MKMVDMDIRDEEGIDMLMESILGWYDDHNDLPIIIDHNPVYQSDIDFLFDNRNDHIENFIKYLIKVHDRMFPQYRGEFSY